jgi:Ribbon-helix-helix protein, copG family
MPMYIDRDLDLVSRRGPIGRRMQINVTDRQYAVLREEAARTGLPMSELIRRALDAALRPGSRLRLRGVELNLGIFREPDAAASGRRRRV